MRKILHKGASALSRVRLDGTAEQLAAGLQLLVSVQIRVATLNVWALPGGFSEHVELRMHAIGERLQSLPVDVIAFQEVWSSQARQALVEAGLRAGFEHASHERKSFGGSGLVTLSRLPIETVHFERFHIRGHPEHPNGEYQSGKGFATLTLRTPEGPVTVINTHLHARYAKVMDNCYRPHRTAQLIQLARRIQQIEGPLLVVGDFNFTEGQPEYPIFTGLAGMRDMAVEVDNRVPTVDSQLFYRRDSNRPDRRIDMVFVRDGSRSSLVAKSLERTFDELLDFAGNPGGYSNHAGLLATAEVAPSLGVSVPTLTRRAVRAAAELLAEGREDALRRQSGGRLLSAAGFCGALFSTAGLRREAVSRRKLLRTGFRAGLLLTLAPALGLPFFSEVVVLDEIEAFDDAAVRLAWLETRQQAQASLASHSNEADTASGLPSPRS